MKTILLIEDDADLSRGITYSLEKAGFGVRCAATLAEGRNQLHDETPDLIVLDVNLPDGDGIDFCRDVRMTSRVPIFMLTARDLEADELAGLEAGADDYVTKPFSLSVLRARIDNLLRRTDADDILHAGAFRLDTRQCKLHHGESEIPISTTEFRLLRLLMSNVGRVLSKEQITSALWENADDYIDDNALSVNISRLRAKIEPHPKKPTIIKTIHGIGYCWVGA